MFLLAIMAFHDTVLLVYHVEQRSHRLIVRDTFRIGTFHDAMELVRHLHLLLFHYLIVADDVQLHVGGDNRNTVGVLRRKNRYLI